MTLTPDDLVDLYRMMLRIRRFEKVAFRLAQEGKYANYHGGMGQEAIPAGVCRGLTPDDMTMITHRGLGVLLARGLPVRDVLTGLYAKEPCPTRGRIPIFHMAEPSLGILAGTSMVGSVIPLATGSALATRLNGRTDVTISFFGDGAVNRGDFHEGINLAAVRKLPIVFFCENNFYAKSMPLAKSTAGGSIVKRAGSYGLPGELVDGNDVVKVFDATWRAIARARAGDGPTFIECETYRWTPHSTAGDREFARTEEELALWKANCPIKRLEVELLADGHVDAGALADIDREIRADLDAAVAFAEAAPYAAPEVALENVYR
jgi:TPP-dependent pyruvate/acetoin dehydrogenase alpha subunit